MSYSKDLRKRAIDLVIEEKYEKCKQTIWRTVQHSERLGNSKKQESPKPIPIPIPIFMGTSFHEDMLVEDNRIK